MNGISDSLNSKIEKVILELPNYSFCHSTHVQDEPNQFFIGRKSILKRLENLIVATSSRTGIILVTGNRGVGKSSLVEELISKTSIPNNGFSNYFSFHFIAIFLILGLQYATNNWSTNMYQPWISIFLVIVSFIFWWLIGYLSYFKKGNKNNNFELKHTLTAIIREFALLPNELNPFLQTRNVLKLILILILCQLFASICQLFASNFQFTHFQIYIVYLSIIGGYYYVRYTRRILIEKYRMCYEERNKSNSIAKAFRDVKEGKWTTGVIITALVTSILSIALSKYLLILGFGIVVIIFIKNYRIITASFSSFSTKRKIGTALECSLPIPNLFYAINDYIKNLNRVYLKINFGHDVLKERDILRLLTRTLTTEYDNFCKSWKHTFYWRVLISTILLSVSYLFYKNIYEKDLLPLIEHHTTYYQNSSQQYYADNSYFINCYNNKYYSIYNLSMPDSIIKRARTKFFVDYMMSDESNYEQLHLSYLTQIDKAINRIWHYIRMSPFYFWEKKEIDRNNIKYNYAHEPVNYAFCIILISFYLFGLLLLRTGLFTTHSIIKRQLKRLNEIITYSAEFEISANTGNIPKLNSVFGIHRKYSRIIADSREIEKELQDILNNIRNIPKFMARPEFIIIFDELDKVSPENQQASTEEKDIKHKETLFASNSTRERQAVILKLLSNMKYFLSTTNAVFIFIAGREMYDMYLADIADRNNYFGSIFNDVIFVPSFITDDSTTNNNNNITTLVEEFVCRHLIPEKYPNVEWTLKEYNKYLEEEIYCDDDDKQKANIKRQKIIATLQQFIIYLAHTSKGAPKKMIQIFESFIKIYGGRGSEHDLEEGKGLIVRQFHNSQFFLSFDYYDQYTIGITSYLIYPVISRLSDSNIQEHSDKLIISTLHFVDYLLKFYNLNFSWRNLDISPEIIEVNHSPELKAIANEIITFFEQIHINKPIISLYEFKFDSVLSQEIFFISKMDERLSAQFNFSLDESLALKQYYFRLLKEKQTEYKEFKNYGNDYVSSIASLQVVLGDLHFLDDELEEAALYYKDGTHLLHTVLKKDKKRDNLELFYLFVRNQLKLAYLYEKRKQPEFAYLLYGEIVKLLVEYRNFDLEKIGISVRKEGEDFVMIKNHYPDNLFNINIETPNIEQNITVYDNPKYSKVQNMKFKQITPKTQQIMFKNMTFEGLQLLYLPLLAKLQILEKRYLVGIIEKDIDLIKKEFEFLIRTIDHCDIKILTADFYSKVGDILYYKNYIFSEDNTTKTDISHYACYFYKKAFIELILNNGEIESMYSKYLIINILKYKNNFLKAQTNAKYCDVMARVLSNLGDVCFQIQDEDKNKNKNEDEDKNKIHCGKCRYQTDGCNFILYKDEELRCESFWTSFWNFIDTPNDKDDLSIFIDTILKSGQLDNIELTLFLYSLSEKFYKRAGQYKSSAFQITKILNVFKYCIRYDKHKSNIKNFLMRKDRKNAKFNYLNLIIRNAIRSLYIANDNLSIFEILKRKENFCCSENAGYEYDIPLQYIQVDSEVSRIILIFNELELSLTDDLTRTIKEMYNKYITSPYQINYSISARIHRLRMKERLNQKAYDIMKDYFVNNRKQDNFYVNILSILTGPIENEFTYEGFPNSILAIFNKKGIKGRNDFYPILEMLVADSIFCLDEILRLIKTEGDSYIFNHRFLAAVYRRLMVWVDIYETLKHIRDYYSKNNNKKNESKKIWEKYSRLEEAIKLYPEENYTDKIERVLYQNMKIDNYLQKLLGKDFREKLSSHYYREQYISHTYQSRETHNGGRAYHNILERMYFIKGDYDDMSSHFNVATERFILNNTSFLEDVKKPEEISKQSKLYDMNRYL